MSRENDWQEHEKKYGSKAVAHTFALQFPHLLSGQLPLNGHKLKKDLLWGKVNSSVNQEICHWVKSSFLSRALSKSSPEFYSLNSEPALVTDDDKSLFRQSRWRLMSKLTFSGLLTWEICMHPSAGLGRPKASPLPAQRSL